MTRPANCSPGNLIAARNTLGEIVDSGIAASAVVRGVAPLEGFEQHSDGLAIKIADNTRLAVTPFGLTVGPAVAQMESSADDTLPVRRFGVLEPSSLVVRNRNFLGLNGLTTRAIHITESAVVGNVSIAAGRIMGLRTPPVAPDEAVCKQHVDEQVQCVRQAAVYKQPRFAYLVKSTIEPVHFIPACVPRAGVELAVGGTIKVNIPDGAVRAVH